MNNYHVEMHKIICLLCLKVFLAFSRMGLYNTNQKATAAGLKTEKGKAMNTKITIAKNFTTCEALPELKKELKALKKVEPETWRDLSGAPEWRKVNCKECMRIEFTVWMDAVGYFEDKITGCVDMFWIDDASTVSRIRYYFDYNIADGSIERSKDDLLNTFDCYNFKL